jgi:hypothetical protein
VTRKRVLALAFLAVALLTPACSRNSHKPVHPVRGQVLLEGKPAAGATVAFHPVGGAAEAPRPSAQTDDQGFFSLTSYASGDGAPEGEYAVTVTWFRPYTTRNLSDGDPNTRNVVPARYANPATTELRATVSTGDNELQPFRVRVR